QPDGAAVVQTRLDPDCARTGGTQHIYALFKPRAAVVVLAMAAHGRRGLECRIPAGTPGYLWFVFLRLGVAVGLHVSDRPLRSVRTAAGLAAPARPGAGAGQFQDAVAVPANSPSALPELADHLLGDATDDRGPSGLRAGDDGLHLTGHSIRRAGP